MWMEGLGRKVLFGILQPRKALKSLMKPRKFSGTDQKCTTSSSIVIHIIYMYVPNRLQIVLLLSCYCAAILHVHQLCIRMCLYTIQLHIVSRGQ